MAFGLECRQPARAACRKIASCPREVEDAKVKCRLECERNTQAPGLWLDIDLYIAESAGSSQRRNCGFNLRRGERFVGFLLYQRAQGINRNSWIRDKLHRRDLLTVVGNFIALAGLLAFDIRSRRKDEHNRKYSRIA